MPIRLFRGRGSGKDRTCPACEQKVAAAATFCPSCYMVFRPEGAADLREHLQGGRLPSDVYLLRKMQAEDPNTGPVIRVPDVGPVPPSPTAPEPLTPQSSQPPLALGAAPPVPVEVTGVGPDPATAPAVGDGPALPPFPLDVSPPESPAPGQASAGRLGPAPPAVDPAARPTAEPQERGRTGVEFLLRFTAPLPPPARSMDEAAALFAWMLERDPLIPNNLERLQAIHAGVFQDKPGSHLEYEQHILLQIADDLALHPTRDAMDLHLMSLAAGYRRAVAAYHVAARSEDPEADGALWQMASTASRLRVEAWIYQIRYGGPPELERRPRLRFRRTSRD